MRILLTPNIIVIATKMMALVNKRKVPGKLWSVWLYMRLYSGREKKGMRALRRERHENILPTSFFSTD